MADHPDAVLSVRGTGYWFAELTQSASLWLGTKVEMWCRRHGLGIIHGGRNALRYTPHFGLTSEEVDLVVDMTRKVIEHFSAA